MSLTAVTSSCGNGPCPAFRPAEGGVVVQGIKTTDPAHLPPGMPDHEGVLFIPEDDWTIMIPRLLAEMGITAEALAHLGVDLNPTRA